jgi:DNA-binding transcriptional LysR family regulator
MRLALALHEFDLNLLKVLDMLMTERSVTRAGKRLGRSQPAVSNSLHRLRHLLGDDLLVRSADGLVLTPRAEALRHSVRDILLRADDCLFQGEAFDPAKMTGVYRISMPDRLTLAVVPPLLNRLRRLAPSIDLHVVTADRQQALELLEADRTELALGWFDEMPRHHHSESLKDEPFYCVFRRGHPLTKSKFTIDAVLSFPHLVVSTGGRSRAVFDEFLLRHGRKRHALVTMSNFIVVPHLLAGTDMIGVFTQLASEVLVKPSKLMKRPVPLDVGNLSTDMIWHVRKDKDKKNFWLRQQIKDVYRKF